MLMVGDTKSGSAETTATVCDIYGVKRLLGILNKRQHILNPSIDGLDIGYEEKQRERKAGDVGERETTKATFENTSEVE